MNYAPPKAESMVGVSQHALRVDPFSARFPARETPQSARTDGRYPTLLASLARTDVLVLDDWGLTPQNFEQLGDLLEIVEDRHGTRSCIATSLLPIDKWDDLIGDATLDDAPSTGSSTVPTSAI